LSFNASLIFVKENNSPLNPFILGIFAFAPVAMSNLSYWILSSFKNTNLFLKSIEFTDLSKIIDTLLIL